MNIESEFHHIQIDYYGTHNKAWERTLVSAESVALFKNSPMNNAENTMDQTEVKRRNLVAVTSPELRLLWWMLNLLTSQADTDNWIRI